MGTGRKQSCTWCRKLSSSLPESGRELDTPLSEQDTKMNPASLQTQVLLLNVPSRRRKLQSSATGFTLHGVDSASGAERVAPYKAAGCGA